MNCFCIFVIIIKIWKCSTYFNFCCGCLLLFKAQNEVITFYFQIWTTFCGTKRKLRSKFRTQSIHSVPVR